MKENLKDFQQITENSTPDFHSSLNKKYKWAFFSSTHAGRTPEQLVTMQVTGVGVNMSTSHVQKLNKYNITMSKVHKMY